MMALHQRLRRLLIHGITDKYRGNIGIHVARPDMSHIHARLIGKMGQLPEHRQGEAGHLEEEHKLLLGRGPELRRMEEEIFLPRFIILTYRRKLRLS